MLHKQPTAVVFAFAFALALAARADAQQAKTVVQAEPIEGIVTVTNVDHQARTMTVRGPQGNETTIAVPKAENMDQVKPGARFKVRYLEEVAVGISKEGEPSAAAGGTVQLSPKGGTPGGIAARTVQVSGVVEAVDPAKREVTIRGPQGSRTMTVGEDVNLEGLKPGNKVSVAYTQAIAMKMEPAQ